MTTSDNVDGTLSVVVPYIVVVVTDDNGTCNGTGDNVDGKQQWW